LVFYAGTCEPARSIAQAPSGGPRAAGWFPPGELLELRLLAEGEGRTVAARMIGVDPVTLRRALAKG
jgi:hypothetical protein